MMLFIARLYFVHYLKNQLSELSLVLISLDNQHTTIFLSIFVTHLSNSYILFYELLPLPWWKSLCVSVTCKAVLARDFISPARNIHTKEICR